MTLHPPTLQTERLVLRPFIMVDAAQVQLLAGDEKVYETTLNVPHPYRDGMAEKWIASHASQFYQGKGITLAVTLKACGTLIGCIGLSVSEPHQRAELGYWIGVPWWGQGYCSEAARSVIRYGFEVLALHKITSHHLASNPASGRVMVKAGMKWEGEMVDHVVKDGVFHNIIVYGMVAPPAALS